MFSVFIFLVYLYIYAIHCYLLEYVVVQLVRHCAISQKVTSSIPDGVIGIIH
jgi:hypothetical protein